jgi:hypothetical protein
MDKTAAMMIRKIYLVLVRNFPVQFRIPMENTSGDASLPFSHGVELEENPRWPIRVEDETLLARNT